MAEQATPARPGKPELPQRRFTWTTPTQAITAGFALAVAAGTLLLILPISHAAGERTDFLTALFTATSSICVTGLITVDTAVHWSAFGHAVILALIQIGGFGVMTLGSVLAVMLAGRLGIRTRFATASATRTEGIGDIPRVLKGIFRTTMVIEALVAIALTLRFMMHYHYEFGTALWHGLFHSVSAFNNAGFALYSDSLMGFSTDAWVCLPICAAIILGGLGFPVLFQLRQHFHIPKRWSMNTRMVLLGTSVLLIGAMALIGFAEWNNPDTLGELTTGEKMLAVFTTAVMPRTAGFNTLDVAAMHPLTWLGHDALMVIGAGPAGTAGGVKITTIFVLWAVAWTEIRSQNGVHSFRRRIPSEVQRQATTVMVFSIMAIMVASGTIMSTSHFSLDQVLFEVCSAFGTVGLSTGITASLNGVSQVVIICLMFIGRLGPVTLSNALAHSAEKRLYQLPEERPIIG